MPARGINIHVTFMAPNLEIGKGDTAISLTDMRHGAY